MNTISWLFFYAIKYLSFLSTLGLLLIKNNSIIVLCVEAIKGGTNWWTVKI